eukprot:SAG31_NODE_1222_length_9294_cov_4.099184_1_plen_650_part_00
MTVEVKHPEAPVGGREAEWAPGGVENPASDDRSHGASAILPIDFGAPKILRRGIQVTGGGNYGNVTFLPPDSPRFVAVAGSNKFLTLFDLANISAPVDGTVVIKMKTAAHTLALAPGGASLCIGDNSGLLRVFSVTSLFDRGGSTLAQPVAEAELLGGSICATAFSHNASRLFVMCAGGPVTVHDTQHPELPMLHSLHFKSGTYPNVAQLLCTALIGNRELVAAVGGGVGMPATPDDTDAHKVQIWHLSGKGEEELVQTMQLETVAECVAMCATDKPRTSLKSFEFAVGTRSGEVYVFDPASWEIVAILAPALGEGNVVTLGFNSDGTKLAAGRWSSQTFTLYDCQSAAVTGRIEIPGSYGAALSFSTSDYLVTGGYTGAFKITLPPTAVRRRIVTMKAQRGEHKPPVITAASTVVAGGVTAVVAGSQLELRGAVGQLLLEKDFDGAELFCHYRHHSPLRFRPDGTLLACVLSSKSVLVMTTTTGKQAFCAGPWPGANVMDIAWSPNGDLLAVCGRFGVAVHDAESGTEVHRLVSNYPCSVAFDPSSCLLAAGGSDLRVNIWVVSTWELKHTLQQEAGEVDAVCFNPTSERIAYWVRSKNEVVVLSLGGARNSSHARHKFPGGCALLRSTVFFDFRANTPLAPACAFED